MISVAMAPVLDGSWLGGVNYYKNLFRALAALDDQNFTFSLLAPPGADCAWVPNWHGIDIVRDAVLQRDSLIDLLRRATNRLVGRDYFLERSLQSKKIDILSHTGYLAGCSDIVTVGWLADLQHRRLPTFFSERESKIRDQSVHNHLRFCNHIIVSSNAARSDLDQFENYANAKVSVLHFVADVPEQGTLPTAATIRKQYGLPERYFYLPNQFWAHKNHSVVLNAVKLLKERGTSVCVVCTGHTEDYRHPDYFSGLKSKIAEAGSDFQVLGVVPFNDAAALMRDSIAVINPSLFEGWSTTVEEAKSCGKCILLSDIPTHREQAPKRGIFFPATSADVLATQLRDITQNNDAASEHDERTRSLAEVPLRQRQFAQQYLDILRVTLGGKK